MRAPTFELPAPWLTRAAFGWAGLLLLAAGAFAQTTERVDMQPGSPIRISVMNTYGFIPAGGFLPLRITIANSGDADGEWRVSANSDSMYYGGFNSSSGAYGTEVTYAVPAHTTHEFELLVPLAETGMYNYRSLQVNVVGPGVQMPFVRLTSMMGGPGRSGGPHGTIASKTRKGLPIQEIYQVNGTDGPLTEVPVYLGLSPSLFRDQGEDIKDYLLNVCRRPLGMVKIDPEWISPDWRAYTGLALLVYTAADWTSTPPAARAAILQWVASGGELRLIADQEGGLALPARDGERYGAGHLVLFSTAEMSDYDFTTASYHVGERSLYNVEYLRTPAPMYAKGTIPPDAFEFHVPTLDNQFVLVALLILVFALLVGPVNLFWLCRGQRRGRLLWITPVLSLGTAAVLTGYILISEGIGGDGIYYRVTLLEPQGKFACLMEVQASKTGVLLRRGFSLPEPAWAIELNNAQDGRSAGEYSELGTAYWGDWIRTRHEQRTRFTVMIPSRAAIRLAPDSAAAPSLTSEYNGTLEEVYYLDAAGRAWKAVHLGNGQTIRLEPATAQQLHDAWMRNILRAPDELRGDLERLTPRPGTFFGLSSSDPVSIEPDLYGLHWTRYRHVVTGRVEP